jgi:hypothetical protein
MREEANSAAAKSLTIRTSAIRAQEAVGSEREGIVREQRDKNTCVKIDAHRSSSSRILLTRVPELSVADNLPIRCAASQSRSAAEMARAGSGIGFNSTTGLP